MHLSLVGCGYVGQAIAQKLQEASELMGAQAMEMYQALKSSDNVSINVSRDGKSENFQYSIE